MQGLITLWHSAWNVSAARRRVSLCLIFKGRAGLAFDQLASGEGKKLHDAHFALNIKGWINHQICEDWMVNIFFPMRTAVHPCIDDKVLLLLEICGSCHHNDRGRKIGQLHYDFWAPANLTSRWQPGDGATWQMYRTRFMEDRSKDHRKIHSTKRPAAQRKRFLILEWSG